METLVAYSDPSPQNPSEMEIVPSCGTGESSVAGTLERLNSPPKTYVVEPSSAWVAARRLPVAAYLYCPSGVSIHSQRLDSEPLPPAIEPPKSR